jgi:peptidoglycan/LPS O-acetylase OafA/YrhL
MQYGVLWSLAVEEHFYLLWPGLVRSLSRRNVIVGAVTVAALCLLLRVLYRVFGYTTAGYTWLAADGLAMGAILAAMARSPYRSRERVRRLTIGAFAASLTIFAAGAPFGIFFAGHFLGLTFRETALDLLCTSAVGLTLLIGASKWKTLVNRPVLQFLGKISYGVYLTHMLVFEFVVHFLGRLWPGLPAAEGHFAVMMLRFGISVSFTLGLMSLSRRYFEEPFLALKERDGTQNAPAPMPLAEPSQPEQQMQSA